MRPGQRWVRRSIFGRSVIRISLLPGKLAEMMWSDLKPYIEQALIRHPGETLENMDWIRNQIKTQQFLLLQIWDGFELSAVAVLEFVKLVDGKCLHIRYLSGDGLDAWVDQLHEKLTEIAKAHDCEWISLTGRLGWKKALRHLNWNPVAIQLRARVE